MKNETNKIIKCGHDKEEEERIHHSFIRINQSLSKTELKVNDLPFSGTLAFPSSIIPGLRNSGCSVLINSVTIKALPQHDGETFWKRERHMEYLFPINSYLFIYLLLLREIPSLLLDPAWWSCGNDTTLRPRRDQFYTGARANLLHFFQLRWHRHQ